MKRDSKLSLALHALGHIAASPERPLRSEDMARFGTTNPVVVRRVLGLLREAGIVTSSKGHDGGWRLSRKATEITVADVYRAVGESFFAPPLSGADTQSHCAIERALHQSMQTALKKAETALLADLVQITIANLAAEMIAC